MIKVDLLVGTERLEVAGLFVHRLCLRAHENAEFSFG